METILTANLTQFPDILHSPPLLCPFRSPHSTKPSILLRFSRHISKSPLRSSSSSNSSCFGGWEDLELPEDPARSDSIRHLLISLGINDKKGAFLFCLGFVCALAISRARFSVVAIVPVSVLAFVAGLSFNGGDCFGHVGGGGIDGKGGNLVGFFEFLDSKIAELKRVIETGNVSRCIEVVETVRLAAVPVKDAIGDNVGGGIGGDGERRSNQKAASRRRESGFDFVQLIGSLVRENLASTKPAKSRDGAMRGALDQLDASVRNVQNGFDCGDNVGGEWKESVPILALSSKMDGIDVGASFRVNSEGSSPSNDVLLEGLRGSGEVAVKSANVEDKSKVPIFRTTPTINAKHSPSYSCESYDNGMLPFEKECADLNRTFQFINRKKNFEKMVLEEKSYRTENMENSSKGGNSSRANEGEMWSFSGSGSALHTETKVEMCNKTYLHSTGKESEKSLTENWNQIGGFSEEKSSVNGSVFENHQLEPNLKSHGTPSPLPSSSDEEFTRNVKEAANLLSQAKECLKNKDDEEAAEIRLYKSANMLSTAISLKPRSLLAVGQLGNTFLLHGELKLKISRDLRTLLSRSDPAVIRKRRMLQYKGLNKQSLSKEKVTSVLIDVCEECEELLVKAGKTYRMALSIDEGDIRALYNWGLALTFRAQLIGDIGPEAAFDADKVYLAAIDKFSALSSRSRIFAPDALFRWGVALQQRSQLRSPDSREKMKLLKQAKSLFEDVLRSDTDNPVVREALFSCISELNFYRQLK